MMKSCEMAKMTSSRIISKEHHRSLLPLPLTPSPSECNRFDVQCLDDEELYDEPDQLMQGLERTTSASPLLAVPVSTCAHVGGEREKEYIIYKSWPRQR